MRSLWCDGGWPRVFRSRSTPCTAGPSRSREIVVRSHNGEEARRLELELSGRVFVGEHELALAMSHCVLERCRA
jgi:hypothetical protein